MAIKGVINRVGTIGAKVAGTQNLRAKQVAIGDSSTITNITNKSINELLDVDAAETDDAILSYDASSDKWTSTTVIDGGTF
ncbi:uncharacterized protein METZ01_LOCUS470927 [marine metagenome]|jgi:hypothetical protein|uniref:Uncharacterized protein n=1 Tax=marine metagenome TaxID=408172 RepID=A0A383BE08_9ZZZZ